MTLVRLSCNEAHIAFEVHSCTPPCHSLAIACNVKPSWTQVISEMYGVTDSAHNTNSNTSWHDIICFITETRFLNLQTARMMLCLQTARMMLCGSMALAKTFSNASRKGFIDGASTTTNTQQQLLGETAHPKSQQQHTQLTP